MIVKEESEKVVLKLNIQKTKNMASSPIITSWQIDGETVEIVADFIFLGSKITADGDCSHEIKRHLTPWKESYDQHKQHIKKQRHYFVNKGLSSLEKAMATHSSTLAWKIPWTEEPGGPPSLGSHRVGHEWSDLAAAGWS